MEGNLEKNLHDVYTHVECMSGSRRCKLRYKRQSATPTSSWRYCSSSHSAANCFTTSLCVPPPLTPLQGGIIPIIAFPAKKLWRNANLAPISFRASLLLLFPSNFHLNLEVWVKRGPDHYEGLASETKVYAWTLE